MIGLKIVLVALRRKKLKNLCLKFKITFNFFPFSFRIKYFKWTVSSNNFEKKIFTLFHFLDLLKTDLEWHYFQTSAGSDPEALEEDLERMTTSCALVVLRPSFSINTVVQLPPSSGSATSFSFDDFVHSFLSSYLYFLYAFWITLAQYSSLCRHKVELTGS